MEDLSAHPQSQKHESQTAEDSSRLVEVVCLDESNVEGGDDENISVSYTIDKIIDSRKEENGKLLYKVRWVSYTWVPEEYLVSFPDLVKVFWLEKQEGEVSPTEDRAIYLEQPCNDQQLDIQSRQDGENQIQEVTIPPGLPQMIQEVIRRGKKSKIGREKC